MPCFFMSMPNLDYENGDGTMAIDFNCDTSHSVTVGKNWNRTFRLYQPVDVQETFEAVINLMTIEIELK